MKQLYWNICGEGDRCLVLLHGWGLNAGVWHCIIDRLAPHFRLHLVDLPGYGRSTEFGAMSLSEMAEIVLQQAPQQAIWLGWSMGGLVASQIALSHPERVRGLITVSSSPCFTAHDEWPGIRPEVLAGFQQQLSEDFQRTVERFLALQTLGTESARQGRPFAESGCITAPNAGSGGVDRRAGYSADGRFTRRIGRLFAPILAYLWLSGWLGTTQSGCIAKQPVAAYSIGGDARLCACSFCLSS